MERTRCVFGRQWHPVDVIRETEVDGSVERPGRSDGGDGMLQHGWGWQWRRDERGWRREASEHVFEELLLETAEALYHFVVVGLEQVRRHVVF